MIRKKKNNCLILTSPMVCRLQPEAESSSSTTTWTRDKIVILAKKKQLIPKHNMLIAILQINKYIYTHTLLQLSLCIF